MDDLVDAAVRIIAVVKALPNSKVENLAPQQSTIINRQSSFTTNQALLESAGDEFVGQMQVQNLTQMRNVSKTE